MSDAKMCMVRWIRDKIRKDKIRTERREYLGAPIEKKTRERWPHDRVNANRRCLIMHSDVRCR